MAVSAAWKTTPVGAIVSVIGGVRATAWAALALALLIATGVQSCRLDSAQDASSDARAKIAVWQQADTNNRLAIKRLSDANAMWAAKHAADEKAGKDAADRLQARVGQLAAQNTNLRKQLENIYAKDPNARRWANTGIPAAVADRLLDGSVSENPRRNR
jgi:hypothetical protein